MRFCDRVFLQPAGKIDRSDMIEIVDSQEPIRSMDIRHDARHTARRRQKTRPSDRNDQIVFSQKSPIYDNRSSLHSKVIDLDTACGFECRQGINQFRRNVIGDNCHPQTPVGFKRPGRRHHCLVVKPISKNGRIDVSTEGSLIDPIDHFLGHREPQREGASIERWRLQ